MKELSNTQKDSKNSFNNSEILQIYNKENNFNNLNNRYNDNSGQITSEKEFQTKDCLYGNNYLNYYLKTKFSNKCFNSNIHKMGNLPVYCFINEKPLLVLGVKNKHLIFTYEIFLHLSFLVLYFSIIYLILPFMRYLLITLYLVCFISHIYLYLINPGIPSIEHYYKMFIKSEQYLRMNENEKKNYYVCEICNIIINYNENIEHCEECEICVENYDHHCFWTGKCITKKNIYAFYCFAFGTMIYILWYFVIIIYWMCSRINELNKN